MKILFHIISNVAVSSLVMLFKSRSVKNIFQHLMMMLNVVTVLGDIYTEGLCNDSLTAGHFTSIYRLNNLSAFSWFSRLQYVVCCLDSAQLCRDWLHVNCDRPTSCAKVKCHSERLKKEKNIKLEQRCTTALKHNNEWQVLIKKKTFLSLEWIYSGSSPTLQ